MRPVRLGMQAFGPYAAEQVLDFGALEGRSLFLIHGPTGSGKTTVLDAMCYALYGDTSGAERDGRQMRSHHADPSCRTEVVFDFALGDRVYRAKRSPEWSRPARRGDGLVTEPHSATLWQLLPGGEALVLESHPSRVGPRVEELLGFRSDQFRQVIMLPQGKFRELLTAGSGQRQAILETLFGTEFFRRVEDALKEAGRDLEARAREARARWASVLEQAEVTSEQALGDTLGRVHSEGDQAWAEVERLRREEEAAAGRLEKARRAEAVLAEATAAAADLADLVEREDEYSRRRDLLVRGQAAAVLAEAETNLLARENEALERAKAVETAEKTAAELQTGRERAALDLAAEQSRQGEREEASRRRGELSQVVEKVVALSEARSSLDELRLRHESGLAERDAARAEVEGLRERLEVLGREEKEEAALAAAAEGLEDRLASVARVLEKWRESEALAERLDTERRALAAARQSEETAEAAVNAAREELARLETEWQAGQAVVLASSLIEGQPCPVCGATGHPRPASPAEEAPQAGDLEEGRRRLAAAQADLDRVREGAAQRAVSCSRVEVKLELVRKDLSEASVGAGSLSEEALAGAQAETERLLERARKAEARLELLATELDVARKRLGELDGKGGRLAEAEKTYLETAAGLASQRAVVDERETGVPEGLRDPNDARAALGEASAQERALLDALERAREEDKRLAEDLAGARAALERDRKAAGESETKAAEARRDFAERLAAKGFAGWDDYAAARQAPADLARLDKEIRDYDAHVVSARERHQRAAKEAEGLVAPDLSEAEDATRKAKSELDAAQKKATELSLRAEGLEKLARQLETAGKAISELDEALGITGRLAEVASGKNPEGISFERFVLAALLDDVLLAASARLTVMSQGRYLLRRVLERSDRRSAGGLDLEVYDAYTGTSRPVATLSGGESFLASLSLALGLADVVSAYAGGLRLDTIFVDEGFGTLDQESLDLALRALLDLQRGGRLVGIISHVPELRERIDARLEVSAGRRGSTARFVVG